MDSSFLRVLALPVYDRELKQIASASDRVSLELALVKAHAPDSARSQRSDKLRQDILDLARRVWIFLSCAAQASKRSDDEIISELNKFGFQLRYIPKETGIFNRYRGNVSDPPRRVQAEAIPCPLRARRWPRRFGERG
jgi:hypothetical protein